MTNYTQQQCSVSRTVLIHTRGQWKFSLADIKKIFCRSHLWSKRSHVLVVAAWNVFPKTQTQTITTQMITNQFSGRHKTTYDTSVLSHATLVITYFLMFINCLLPTFQSSQGSFKHGCNKPYTNDNEKNTQRSIW